MIRCILQGGTGNGEQARLIPQIDFSLIPTLYQERLKSEINELVDRYYSSALESIVDLCRKAATTLINCYIKSKLDSHGAELDLSRAVKVLEKLNQDHKISAKYNLVNLGRVIATLHSRGKSNEVANYNLRPLSQKDSELALNSLNCMLCDLGWAKWR